MKTIFLIYTHGIHSVGMKYWCTFSYCAYNEILWSCSTPYASFYFPFHNTQWRSYMLHNYYMLLTLHLDASTCIVSKVQFASVCDNVSYNPLVPTYSRSTYISSNNFHITFPSSSYPRRHECKCPDVGGDHNKQFVLCWDCVLKCLPAL